MFDTMQICNFRDCNDDHEKCPHDAVNPCRVFRHNETGHWYDEMTGTPIRMLHLKDGVTFDVQSWLESQFMQAVREWYRDKSRPVHKKYVRESPKQAPTTPAIRPPRHSAKKLDQIADLFIRTRASRAELVAKVRELGDELHGYKRLGRKWGSHPLLQQKVREIQEQRDALRKVQSETDKRNNHGRRHLRANNAWTRKWAPKGGRWTEFVLVCEHKGRTFIIDRDGLRIESQFIYLPDLDGQFLESAVYAEKRLDIKRSAWKRLAIPQEKIGAPLRRYGKRNANGRRIRARAEQNKYAEAVHKLIRDMRAVKLSVFRIRDDVELMKYYHEHIAPRLSRAT